MNVDSQFRKLSAGPQGNRQVPVRGPLIIVDNELQALRINAIRADFSVPWKRFDEITVTVGSINANVEQ